MIPIAVEVAVEKRTGRQVNKTDPAKRSEIQSEEKLYFITMKRLGVEMFIVISSAHFHPQKYVIHLNRP